MSYLFGFVVVVAGLLHSLHFQLGCEVGESGYYIEAPAIVVIMSD